MHHGAHGSLPSSRTTGATPIGSEIEEVALTPPAADHATGTAGWDEDGLINFFARHGRDLPWRRSTAGPWGVMVSEVMLQQTPVQRVLPVYPEWMTRWPTPADLAASSSGEAVRAWGRLGYPRRALRLHEAARAITRDHDGRVPNDLDELLALPGIGAYTARAIATFAFGQRHPVVDTNVRRVISRAVRGVDEHGPATATDRAELATLLPDDPERAATLGAALMELGALRCTVRAPDCARCPLADTCAWRAAGYPAGPPRRRPAQRWVGTDRQVRGEIMAELRRLDDPIDIDELAAGMTSYRTDPTQWRRCLESLTRDGLAARDEQGRISLPR